MQGARGGTSLARRYVAGATAEEGLARAQTLFEDRGVRSSLFYLGEYVSSLELAAENAAQKEKVAGLLGASGLDAHVSIDPTQIGHIFDAGRVREYAHAIARRIASASAGRPGLHALMLDMEDPSVTDSTIALHDDLQEQGLPAALTLQACLRRTEADLKRQIARGSKLRLVKGAFPVGARLAWTRQADIKANSRALIDLMFSAEARRMGFYPFVATHDARLQEYAMARAYGNGWEPERWEFEMLLGVRGDLAGALAAAGRRIRLYTPFGADWWPYAMRQIGENPRNALLLARSLLNLAPGGFEGAGLKRP